MQPLSSVFPARALTPKPLLAFILCSASLASAQTIWMQFNPVSPALNSTDDFLIPFTLGSNKQIVNLSPSLGQKETWVIGPEACTPKGQKAPKDQCVLYRGGVFDSSKSSSFTSESAEFEYRNQIYVTYSTGSQAKESIFLPGEDGDLEVKDYDFALVGSSNMTSGMLGLGKESVFLNRLFDDGKIASRSFGLHVGVDIWNHPWPVLNPSFDESGNKPTTKNDFNTGVGKRAPSQHKHYARQETDENELPVRQSHKFPGSLTLGGYDRAKISSKTKPITVPLAEDGTLQLSLTNIVARNSKTDSPYDGIIDKSFKVVIDADTPYMYFPQNISWQISRAFDAVYGEPRLDFFYTYLADREKYLGNVTMTFKAPDGKGDEIEIMIPPSVWYQPIGYMRNFNLVGDDYYNYGMPIKQWADDQATTQPIILGRSFLKAAYLFVNYDANEFQIAQVAFANKTQDIVTVKPGESIPIGSGNSTGSPNNSTNNSTDDPKAVAVPIPVLAGAAGGGVALVIILIIALLCLRKRRNREKAKQHQQLEDRPNTGVSDLPVGGRMELDSEAVAMVKLSRPSTAVSGVGGAHAELPVSGIKSKFNGTHVELPDDSKTPRPELPAGGFYKQAELGTAYSELSTKHDYHEMPSTTVSPTTPQQAHTPTSPHPPVYPPPSQSPPISMPSTPGYPGYNYQQYPPPPGSPPSISQQYPPPPGPPPANIYQAGYIPPPPPPNPPPQGSPYTYSPHQQPGQVYQPHARPKYDPATRASLHEMA